jgi:5-methylcytosine-specific restriction protein A
MPSAPPRMCPTCKALILGKRCVPCEAKRQAQLDLERPDYYGLYKTAAWRRMRTQFLKVRPTCEACIAAPATTVDHIKPHRGDTDLFWDVLNLQSLCTSCHSSKTAREVNERNVKSGMPSA